jgi:hypothetical protein
MRLRIRSVRRQSSPNRYDKRSLLEEKTPLARLAVVVTLGSFLVGQPKVARGADTDVLLLINDERLVGEVKRLEEGRLEFKTSVMSTVYVEWDKILEITAVGAFEIETSDGRRYLGALGSSGPGKLLVTRGSDSTPLDLATVVRIVPIGESFFRRIDGSLDTGFAYTKSSGVAQLNLGADATFRRPAYELSASFAENYTRRPNDPDTSRNLFKFGHTRFLSNRWELLSQGTVEQNQDLGFDLRATGAFGVGRQLVKTNRSLFGVTGGLALGREAPVVGETVTNLDAMLALNASYFTYSYPKTNATVSLVGYPGLSNWGRVRLEANGTLRREIIRNFFLVLGGYDSFDNRPPTSGADKNDVGVTLSIGWTFGR